LEKEEDNSQKKTESDAGSVSGSSIEVLDKSTCQDKQEETDSDSIETISDDEILVAQSHLASYCNLTDNNQGTSDSLTSTISTISVASDGIPIKSQNDENPEEQYEWNSEGEREIPEDRVEEIAPQEINDSEPEDDINPVLEPGEPGYDLDDDGLPGEPLPPLPQEVELYPSQELDPNYQAIRKEKIYKHDKNLQVDHFLTAILVLALALAIGLGIGHFLGVFLSATTSIDSSLFGINPDPYEQKFGVDESAESIQGSDIKGQDTINTNSKSQKSSPSSDMGSQGNKNSDSKSQNFGLDGGIPVSSSKQGQEKANSDISSPETKFSIFAPIKNMFTRLGLKFGYFKKPTPHPDVLHDFQEEEEYLEFYCMTADDVPIMIDNQPVTVSQPEDCSQYYQAHLPIGYATLMEPPTIFMEEAKKIFKSDDQDLDDRVIKQLWEENQDLRDQVHQYKSDHPQNDEAMAAILRDKINDLLTANADLEREVVKLRYADAARGAAESVETLNKLRKTRDTLNDIVNENDQLKIEVGKARYAEPLPESSCSEEKERLEVQVMDLKREIMLLRKSCSKSSSLFDTIETAFNVFQESTIDPIISKIQKEDFPSSWTSKRNEELRQKQEHSQESKQNDDNKKDDDADDEIKNESADNLSKYLAELLRIKKQLLNRDGSINWSHANQFMESLDEDLGSKFGEVGILAKQEMEHLLEKFRDLKSMIDTKKFQSNVDAAKTASLKFLKSIIGAVEDLQEASDEAAEESDWVNGFKAEILETKNKFDEKWQKIQKKWDEIISKVDDDDDDDDDNDDEDDDEDNDNEKHYKNNGSKHDKRQKWRKDEKENDDDDDDDDDHEKYQDKQKKKQKWKKYDDDEDDEGYHSSDEYKNRKKHHRKQYSNTNHKNNSTKADWEQKRGLEREKMRKEKERSDWIFERAKHRKDIRYEETRGDWYFDRKHQRNVENDITKSKEKGEKLRKTKNEKTKLRGETENKFNEKVQYRERHFKEHFKNNGRY